MTRLFLFIVLALAPGLAVAGDISTWSTAPDSNVTAAPDGFPEPMDAGDVNDAAREVMAAIKRYLVDRDAYTVSTGSANAYVLAATQTVSAYATGQTYSWIASFQNTGTATLNVDAVGAKTIMKHGGTPLASGDIRIGSAVTVVYLGSGDIFLMTSQLSQ